MVMSEQTAKVGKVQHRTLRELAFEELRREFIAGDFAPGDSVTIAELSARLEVGLMPTREAVQHLASLGAFEFMPNRSVRVPICSLKEIDELYTARILNESHAGRLAAANCEPEGCALLREQLENLEQAVESRDVAAVQIANADFDFAIYRMSGNSFLFDVIERLWLRIGPLYRAIWRAKSSQFVGVEDVIPTHRKLIDLIEAREEEAVGQLIEKLLLISRDWILEHPEVLQSSGRE